MPCEILLFAKRVVMHRHIVITDCTKGDMLDVRAVVEDAYVFVYAVVCLYKFKLHLFLHKNIMADTHLSLLGTGTAGAVISVVLLLYKTINHKKCRSRCCGKVLDASFEAGDITPPQEREFVVVNPHLVGTRAPDLVADGGSVAVGVSRPPVPLPPHSTYQSRHS